MSNKLIQATKVQEQTVTVLSRSFDILVKEIAKKINLRASAGISSLVVPLNLADAKALRTILVSHGYRVDLQLPGITNMLVDLANVVNRLVGRERLPRQATLIISWGV